MHEPHWSIRGVPLIDATLLDLRFGVRSLATARHFACVAFLTIVLTVSGISTVFTVVNAVLLTPLPSPDSDRLVSIRQQVGNGPLSLNSVSVADLMEVRTNSGTLETIAGFFSTTFVLDPDNRPYTVRLWRTTSDLFPLLSIRPILGRGLEREDEQPAAAPVAVISYDVWTNQFGRREDVLGQVIRFPLPGRASEDYTVIGVLGADFELPLELVPPFPSVWTTLPIKGPLTRGGGGLTAIAKLRSGVSVVAARAELDAVGTRLEEAYPDTNHQRRFVVVSLLDLMVGNVAHVLWVFLGAVTCVLLIGLANLISLQVARNAAREREFAVCAALGGGRARLIRQQLAETLLLSLAGAFAGLLITWGALQVVVGSLPVGFPRTDQITLAPVVFVFTFGVSLMVGTIVGVIPAWRVSRPDLTFVINEGTKAATMSPRRSRLQRLLIVVETALALILLVGAALLTNSFWRLFTVDAGMEDEELLSSITVSLPPTYQPVDRSNAFWRSALERVRALPQVNAAALSLGPPPLVGTDSRLSGVMAEGRTSDPKQDGVTLSQRPVSAGYFETLGILLRAGRPILDSDDSVGEPVAVLNLTGARALWPAEDPVGKRFRDPLYGGRLTTVVGVVPDFRQRRLNEDPLPQLYRPYQQDLRPHGLTGFLLIRAHANAAGLADAIRAALASLEPRAVVVRHETMAGLRWRQVAAERFRTGILSSFALTATFLVLVGIFGLVAYSVAQRTREIGVRIAIGATHADILWMVISHGMLPTALGVILGLIGAIGLSRFVASFLYQLTPTDPMTYAITAASLLVASLAASLIPARRATRLDPMVALRCE